MELGIKVALAVIIVGVLSYYYMYQSRQRQQHERECFDAMLRMLLQPTSSNITSLENLLKKRRLSDKVRNKLLYEAELEADCLSIMPTGELRSSQPFLQQRYNQILATAESHVAVSKLIKTRLTNFRAA